MAAFVPTSSSWEWKTQLYLEQEGKEWPSEGRHILAQYDDQGVVVYQAYCPEIAKYATDNQRFGGNRFSFTRMSWIKTNFLWMMYRCGWATKPNQEHVLAIRVTHEGFNTILSQALTGHAEKEMGVKEKSDVRLQWDPDHLPNGESHKRRAIQLGMRNKVLESYSNEWILDIKDITSFVTEQHKIVQSGKLDSLLVARERPYPVKDVNIVAQLGLETAKTLT